MAKFRTRIYKANSGNLKIKIEAAKPIYKDGQKVGDEPGKWADFVGGIFETDDQKVIDYLKNLPTFGIEFFEVPEDGEEEQSPAKSEEKSLESLTKQELLARAQESGVEVSESLTKAEIIDRLKAK